MFYIEPMYLVFAIPGLIVAGLASMYTHTMFMEYSRKRASSGMTGAEAAARMLSRAGINDVRIERVDGFLSDHYDPLARRSACLLRFMTRIRFLRSESPVMRRDTRFSTPQGISRCTSAASLSRWRISVPTFLTAPLFSVSFCKPDIL